MEKSVEIAENYDKIVFFEEGIKSGGIAEKFSSELLKSGWKGQFTIKAVENSFVSYGETERQLAKFQLDTEGIIKTVGEIIGQT